MNVLAQPPLEILIYSLNYAPEITGTGRYTGDIGSFLAAQGHRVHVVTAPPHYPGWKTREPYHPLRYIDEQFEGAAVVRCPILLKSDMRGFWRLLAPLSFAFSSAPLIIWKVLRHRPKVLFCVEPTLFGAPFALLAAKLGGARTILHVQDLEIDAAFAVGHLKGGWMKTLALRYERFLLRKFNSIVAISSKMQKKLEEKGVESKRITLIRNWVDLEQIQPLTGKNRFREEIGLTEKAFVVLYSGNIGVKQALPILLEAAVSLRNVPDLSFVIAGEGPEKPCLMARYGHLPNVHFLPLQPEARLCEFLNLADLHALPQDQGVADLVLPSKLGGMLASGKPVLVTANPGTELHDLLIGTAILVPAGDSAAVASEISLLMKTRAHPAIGDGRKLAALFSRQDCLKQLHHEIARL
jgi:colanic acid biosynthesis glycosyl transferase WcaI